MQWPIVDVDSNGRVGWVNMKRLILIAFLSLLVAAPVFASGPDPVLLGGANLPSTGLLRSGLLNFSRLEVSNSLSFATSSSSLYGNQSAGLWMTRFGYRVSNPLHVAVDVGAVLNTSGDGPVFNEKNLFLRGFEMNYQPNNHFQLNVAYQHWPAGSNLQGLYGFGASPWGSPLGSVR
jgi:hypothetical protein